MEKSSPRNRQLDLLRGLAILLVLGRHLPDSIQTVSHPLLHFFSKWRQIGWIGVDLFFVLSGFLVSGLLFREYLAEGRIDAWRFFLRRGIRIWPAFYLMIAVSLAFVWRTTELRRILVEIFFLQSYFPQTCLWAHTWTLAIEEHFYLGLILLIFVLARSRARDPFRILPLLWLFSAVACLWGRLMMPHNDFRLFTYTHLRIDALLFGVALSYLYHFHRTALEREVRRLWPVLAGIAALCLIPVFSMKLGKSPFLTGFGLTGTYLAAGLSLLLFLFVAPGREKPHALSNALAFVGVRSYSLYLWHFPFALLVAQPLALAVAGQEGLWWAVFFYLAGTLVTGAVSYRWFEKPILDWRDKRVPAKAKAVGAPSV